MDWKRYFRLAKGRAAQLARADLSLLNQRMLKRSQRYLIVWTQRYPFGFFAIVAMVVVILWLLNPIYIRWLSGTVEKAGPLGDSFGALTSLFTGAAFVGLIATLMQQQREIRMQRQDLKLQRDEMKAARDELSGQKKVLQLQFETQKRQAFEQTLLNVISSHNEQINDLLLPITDQEKLDTNGVELKGIEAIGFYARWLHLIDEDLSTIRVGENGTEAMSSYHRRLALLFDMITSCELEDSIFYAKLLESSLSDSEFIYSELLLHEGKFPEYQAYLKRFERRLNLSRTWRGYKLNEVLAELRARTS